MTDESQHISGTIEFPINEADKLMVDVILSMPPPSRWRAFNAVRHLNRGWRLRVEDPEMAGFRSITAEEEAATALFLSLKRRRYKGANKLKHNNHLHKNAVIPFIDAVSRVFAKFRDIAPPVELVWDQQQTPARLILRVAAVSHSVMGTMWALPQPPLNFFSSASQPGLGMVRLDFAAEIEQIATEAKTETIIDYLRERANVRNKLLYATADGYPGVSGDIEASLRGLQRNVMTILRLYFMIDPYAKHQGFVQQCLDAFIKMLNLVPKDIQFE